jgi:hypothetical protein
MALWRRDPDATANLDDGTKAVLEGDALRLTRPDGATIDLPLDRIVRMDLRYNPPSRRPRRSAKHWADILNADGVLVRVESHMPQTSWAPWPYEDTMRAGVEALRARGMPVTGGISGFFVGLFLIVMLPALLSALAWSISVPFFAALWLLLAAVCGWLALHLRARPDFDIDALFKRTG